MAEGAVRGAYQLITLVTLPVSCQTAWHANRTSTFPGRYGRPGGAACVDGGRSRTSPVRELCRRGRWHDTTGKPSPGSARGIPGRLADRVGVSPHPAAAPFGDGVARPADGWPDTDLACSLADPDGVGLDPVSDADGRGWESMTASHHPGGWRRAPGGRMRYWIVSSTHGRLGGICFAAAGCRAGPRDRMVGRSADARMANPDRVVRNHRFPSLPPVRVHGLASRVPPPATDRIADDREARHRARPAPVCTFTGVDGGWSWRAARRRRCPEPTSGRRSGIRRAVRTGRWSRTGAGRRSAGRIVRWAGPIRCPARASGPMSNGPGASTQAACTRTDGSGGVRGRWESVAEASRQAASGDPARQGGTAGGPSHAVEPRGQDGTYWRATLRGDMRALPRRAVRSRDRDTTTPIMTASRRPEGPAARAAAASAAGASPTMSGWRPPPPAAPWACSRGRGLPPGR